MDWRTIGGDGDFIGLLREADRDIVSSLKQRHLWLALAKEDILDTYQHTSIGILWAVFSYSIMVFSLLIVFGLDGQAVDPRFVAHLATGLLAWNFVSMIVTQGATVYLHSESFIKGSGVPLTVYVLHNIARNLILDAFAAIAAIGILLWYGFPKSMVALASLPAILLLVLAAVPVQLMLASLGAYARDVKQIIDNIMRAAFFLTPIFWESSPGSVRETIANWNPFSGFIEIFRAPLARGVVPWDAWSYCIWATGLLWVAGVLVFALTRRKIVLWI